MGGGSSTSTVRKRDPEPEELTSIRAGIYNMVAPLAGINTTSGGTSGTTSSTSADAAASSGKPGNDAASNMLEYMGANTTGTQSANQQASTGTGYASPSEDWNKSLFGSAWNTTQGQIQQANQLYNNLAGQSQGLANNVTNASGQLSDLGNKVVDFTNGIIYDTSGMKNAADKISGVGDQQGDLAKTIQAFTESGDVPQAVKDNLNAAINSELNKNTGSTLNNLASRGVLNSSVTNRSLDSLSNSAADAYAKNYLQAYNSVLNGYTQTGNTLAGQADTYGKALSGEEALLAAQRAGNDQKLSGWNTASGALQNALSGYSSALSNNADMMKTTVALPETLSNSLMAQFSPAYNYWKDLQSSYDGREDYDTVVSSGK